MFSTLSDKLTNTLNTLRGRGRLTEKNIKDTLKNIRKSLLDADVSLAVIKSFIADVQKKSLGAQVMKSIRPGDALIKIVKDELTHILGDECSELNLNAPAPLVILMAGLQGSGKTTTTAKLARYLKNKEKKSVLLTSTDIYRPAAIEQLKTLAEQIEADYFPSNNQQKPAKIAKDALQHAKQHHHDILIIDTAGRNHIDNELMDEIANLSAITKPTETLLVVDSMAGQDAANTAKTFNDRLELSGIILTKTDGDARGGAALSMRIITGKPIKFMGTGEKVDGLEAFHPDRVASRILGMGDIVSLVEHAQSTIDQEQVDKLNKKIKKGKRFDFNDFLGQLKQLKKLGGVQSVLSKLPGMGQLPPAAQEMMDDGAFIQMESIVLSMTLKERRFPDLINGSRKRRIAAGSGTTLQDINKLLKQFSLMQKMLKKMKGDKMMKKMKNMKSSLPPELLDQLPDDLK